MDCHFLRYLKLLQSPFWHNLSFSTVLFSSFVFSRAMSRRGTLVVCVQNLDFSGANQVVLNIVSGRIHQRYEWALLPFSISNLNIYLR